MLSEHSMVTPDVDPLKLDILYSDLKRTTKNMG